MRGGKIVASLRPESQSEVRHNLVDARSEQDGTRKGRSEPIVQAAQALVDVGDKPYCGPAASYRARIFLGVQYLGVTSTGIGPSIPSSLSKKLGCKWRMSKRAVSDIHAVHRLPTILV